MAEDRGKLTTVVWPEIFPWLNLVTALRLAFNPRALVFAALAWVAMTAGWRLCGSVFTAVLSPAADSHLAADDRGGGPVALVAAAAAGRLVAGRRRNRRRSAAVVVGESPVVQGHLRLAAPFFGLFNPRITAGEFFFLLVLRFVGIGGLVVLRRGDHAAGGHGAGPRGIVVVGLSGRLCTEQVAVVFRGPVVSAARRGPGRHSAGAVWTVAAQRRWAW